MKILTTWPTKPRKLTQVEKAEPYLDGQIYEFTIDDCAELFDMTIVSPYDHHDEEESLRHTEYLRSRALPNLESILKSGVRAIHGPYQSRLKYVNDTLIFQFTGLQECRFKTCKTLSIDQGKGYCQIHWTLKKQQGKV